MWNDERQSDLDWTEHWGVHKKGERKRAEWVVLNETQWASTVKVKRNVDVVNRCKTSCTIYLHVSPSAFLLPFWPGQTCGPLNAVGWLGRELWGLVTASSCHTCDTGSTSRPSEHFGAGAWCSGWSSLGDGPTTTSATTSEANNASSCDPCMGRRTSWCTSIFTIFAIFAISTCASPEEVISQGDLGLIWVAWVGHLDCCPVLSGFASWVEALPYGCVCVWYYEVWASTAAQQPKHASIFNHDQEGSFSGVELFIGVIEWLKIFKPSERCATMSWHGNDWSSWHQQIF